MKNARSGGSPASRLRISARRSPAFGALGAAHGAADAAHRVEDGGDRAGGRDEDRNPEFGELEDRSAFVARRRGDDEIGAGRDDGLVVEVDQRADLRFAPRFLRPVARRGNSHQALAGSEHVDDLRDAGRKRNDALRAARNRHLPAQGIDVNRHGNALRPRPTPGAGGRIGRTGRTQKEQDQGRGRLAPQPIRHERKDRPVGSGEIPALSLEEPGIETV